tara:strand:- start:329 stop:601 length:273 start_codon:yes stop_codon:yes gene_type:complete
MADTDLFSFKWLSLKQTKEEEFRIEVETREILNSEDVEEIRLLCATLYKENWAKDQILKSCLGRIGELEGKLLIRGIGRKPLWIKKLFRC